MTGVWRNIEKRKSSERVTGKILQQRSLRVGKGGIINAGNSQEVAIIQTR